MAALAATVAPCAALGQGMERLDRGSAPRPLLGLLGAL